MIFRLATFWQPSAGSRRLLFGASLVVIVLVAYLHVVTGVAYEFYIFFAPPVVWTAWLCGRGAGFCAAFIAVGAWFVADQWLNDQATLGAIVFNSGSRLVVYCLSVWLLSRLRFILEREKRLAAEDALTQLPNRREFSERGRQALGQTQREGSPITAAFIDLDKFKQVNDEMGHEAGDALLICVADVLAARLRSSDVAARLGGDEFALLLPGMRGGAAGLYVEDLRQRLLKAMAQRGWPVTFSIGVASYESAPDDLDVLLVDADRLMYQAKESGRDRVVQEDF